MEKIILSPVHKLACKLRDYEECVSKIYHRLSEVLPEYNEFFKKLALEEERHRVCYQVLLDHHINAEIMNETDVHLKSGTVDIIYNREMSFLNQINSNSIDLKTALLKCMEIEGCMVDKELFSFFERNLDQKAYSSIRSIISDEGEHMKDLDCMLEAIGYSTEK